MLIFRIPELSTTLDISSSNDCMEDDSTEIIIMCLFQADSQIRK